MPVSEKRRLQLRAGGMKYRRTQKGRDAMAKWLKGYRKREREKNRAHGIANKAIPLEGLCRRCRKLPAVGRHHEDYSKPLDVVLACKSCHDILDAEKVKRTSACTE